ncbi:hypothetical protein AX15_003693 [Amanita polypyramis BW_CC]|nr:hypothetical protein AX15_003693 [Amanita polypyramis BW_CC]
MKIYTEKATQTDSLAVPTTPSIALSSSGLGLAPLKFANGSALETGFMHKSSAYTYSEADISAGKSPLRSSIAARQRYTQLPFHRPVEFKSSTKRVVSLPEEFTDKQHPKEASQRVVSMPEKLKLSPGASDSSSSLDISAISVESNILAFAKPSRLHTYPHSDLPSTPSPPSSPESIMIIGNDSQVPRTLLRPGCAYNQRCGDGGWISWANSPPRPIPALHGPLSLPYARCPSGAEGTIIEGEDLTNMIWGLNVDEAQFRSHGYTGSCQKNNTVPPRMQKSPKLCALTLPDHGPIDLSQLAVPHMEQYVHETIRGTQSPINSYREGNTHGRASYIKVGHHKTREVEVMQTQDWYKGLGLNWQDAIELPPPQQKIPHQGNESSILKPSAPPFMPSSSPASHTLPRVVVEPCFSDFLQSSRRPAVVDQPSRVVSYLPTPPDSSSPLWSPYASTPSALDMVSPQIALHDISDDKQLLLSQVLSSSIAITDCMQDFSCWASEQLQSSANIRHATMENHSSSVIITTSDLVNSISLTEAGGLSASRDLGEASPSPASDPPRPAVGRILQQSNGQTCPVSPENRFRGISQQPRSIPLARLIQRRLSSVAEEDIKTLMEDKTASLGNPSRPPQGVSGSRTSEQTKIACHDAGALTCQTIRGTQSPSDFDPQTCKELNHTVTTVTTGATDSDHDNITKFIVRLPGSDVPPTMLLNTVSDEKENSKLHAQSPTARKKLRNRRGRNLPAQPPK